MTTQISSDTFKQYLIDKALKERDFDLIKRIQSGEYFNGKENVELVKIFPEVEKVKSDIADEKDNGLISFREIESAVRQQNKIRRD